MSRAVYVVISIVALLACSFCAKIFYEGTQVPIISASPPALNLNEAVTFQRQLKDNGYGKDVTVETHKDSNGAIIKFTATVDVRDCSVVLTRAPGQVAYEVTAINGAPRSLPITAPRFHELEANLTIHCLPSG